MTSSNPVLLTIAGKKWIPAKIYQTGRQLHGLDLDVLYLSEIYCVFHAPDRGDGEIPLTINLPQLPYTTPRHMLRRFGVRSRSEQQSPETRP